MGSWTLNKLENSKNIQILITALHVQNPSDDFYEKIYYSIVPLWEVKYEFSLCVTWLYASILWKNIFEILAKHSC